MNKTKLRILVLSGGRGGEREVSLESGRVVARSFDAKKFEVLEAQFTKELDLVFLPNKRKYPLLEGLKMMKKMKIDCVFPALHGEFGEDGKLQTLLELLRIPFVGSDSAASCIAMDKGASNALFIQAGFNVPRYLVLRSLFDVESLETLLSRIGKVVIKPVCSGSSVGVKIFYDAIRIEKLVLKNLRNSVPTIVQEYVSGRELTCGVIEKKSGETIALVPTEIRPRKSEFFDYTAKYDITGSEEITPPELPEATIEKLQDLALRAHRVLGCRGLSRSDFILTGKRLFILETNTLPGMTKTSLLPQGAAACGISFPNLLTLLVERALL